MKVAIHSPAGAAGARLVETFHLTGAPSPVALASDPEDLIRAGRLAVTLRRIEAAATDSLTAALAGCSAAVFIPGEKENPGRIPAEARAFAEAARHARLRRVVMVSDVTVHGHDLGKAVDEDSSLPRHEPGSRPAALSSAEATLLETCARNHPVACVLRAGRLYGARVPEFAALASALTAHEPATDGGDSAQNGLHIDNLVAAVRVALSAKIGDQRVFIVTDTGGLTRDGFRRAVARELGVGREEAAPAASPMRRTARWHIPSTRAERVLGYRPAIDFDEAIRRSCAWWRFTRE